MPPRPPPPEEGDKPPAKRRPRPKPSARAKNPTCPSLLQPSSRHYLPPRIVKKPTAPESHDPPGAGLEDDELRHRRARGEPRRSRGAGARRPRARKRPARTTPRRGEGKGAKAEPRPPCKAAEDASAEDDEIAEPSEKDKASGDFVWDEEESEALRQAARRRADRIGRLGPRLPQAGRQGRAAQRRGGGRAREADRGGALRANVADDRKSPTRARLPAAQRNATWRGSAVTVDRAKNHLLEANLRLVVSLAKRTPAAAWPSSTSSRKATSA